MNILNLYAGLGGNRKLWEDVEVTSVEYNEDIAEEYQKMHPEDKVVVGDAHAYLLEHHEKFDFIWSSPPCQSHSRMVKATKHKIRKYPDMSLYEEILFLQNFYKGSWVVENVVPYYKPLVDPTFRVGRHLFWASFEAKVEDVKRPKGFVNKTNLEGRRALMEWLGFETERILYYEGNHCPAQVLRNCVHPAIGKQILDAAKET